MVCEVMQVLQYEGVLCSISVTHNSAVMVVA